MLQNIFEQEGFYAAVIARLNTFIKNIIEYIDVEATSRRGDGGGGFVFL
jgi:hypothetical protein